MVGEIAQRMKAERVALSATVDASQAENRRLQEGLGKALQEVAALQAELAALRKVGVGVCMYVCVYVCLCVRGGGGSGGGGSEKRRDRR